MRMYVKFAKVYPCTKETQSRHIHLLKSNLDCREHSIRTKSVVYRGNNYATPRPKTTFYFTKNTLKIKLAMNIAGER